jgi:diguanylate cyclase (GGDEF)-like protein
MVLVRSAARASASYADASSGRPIEVMVVDPDARLRTWLGSRITGLGYRCRLASRGLEALRMHRAKAADVFVVDWELDDDEGLELWRRLRARERGRYTYVLCTSELAAKLDAVEVVRAGADAFLPKPVDAEELEARLVAAERVVRAYRELADRNVDLRHETRAFFVSARVDPLTGIANRLRLEEDVRTLQGQMSRYGRDASIAMCDVDSFKKYNDHHGHLRGDDALRRIASSIRTSLRTADDVYRYGGEEFLVVLREQGLDAASAAMDRVRLGVQRLGIPQAPDAPLPVLTISVGTARIERHGTQTVREAIDRADRALYRAKAEGGNRVSG